MSLHPGRVCIQCYVRATEERSMHARKAMPARALQLTFSPFIRSFCRSSLNTHTLPPLSIIIIKAMHEYVDMNRIIPVNLSVSPSCHCNRSFLWGCDLTQFVNSTPTMLVSSGLSKCTRYPPDSTMNNSNSKGCPKGNYCAYTFEGEYSCLCAVVWD